MAPNHYFSLADHRAHRFWPVGDVATVALDDAVTRILASICGIALAASRRNRLHVAITGGYDSRVIVAATRPLHDRIRFFTVQHPHVGATDLAIAEKVAARLGLDYQVHAYVEPTADFLAAFDRNAGYMVSGQCRMNARTYLDFPPDSLFLEGAASPIGKASYYKKHPHPEMVTAEFLAGAAGFSGSPLALAEFQRWLEGAPAHTNVSLLDLFFWEQRTGNWNAMDFTAQGIARRVMSPFNCREVLELMLGVAAEHRRHPHRLHRELCRAALPELESLDFNVTGRDKLIRLARRLYRKLRAWRQPSAPMGTGASRRFH
jgi:hypothetical protein